MIEYEDVVQYIIKNQNALYRIAYSYAHNREVAEDIVQNSICKILTKYDTIKNKKSIKSWVYKVLINESIQYFREHKPQVELSEIALNKIPYEDDSGHEDEKAYWKVMELPEIFKTVVILRYYEDFTLKEISEITNTNISTVKYRLYSALKKLRKKLESEK